MQDQQEIITAAFKQFKLLGFKSVTMDDIARKIGISKKTLYELFKDKDELVLECIKYMLNDNQAQTEKALKNSINAIDQAINILMIMEKMIRGMNPVCYLDLQRFYPSAAKYLNDHKDSFMFQCISDNLKQGIQEGFYREDIDIEIISRFRMESALIVFQHDLFPQETYDIVKVNTQIFAHYIYGIASSKGHKMIESYLKKINK
ncbi:MAG: TetR/AcrR family transcriptional regulator [Chitinophagaceae bacterium]|nr:TetR/AcrR family transcriptional regulator [Chitinophagaceae bacterium]